MRAEGREAQQPGMLPNQPSRARPWTARPSTGWACGWPGIAGSARPSTGSPRRSPYGPDAPPTGACPTLRKRPEHQPPLPDPSQPRPAGASGGPAQRGRSPVAKPPPRPSAEPAQRVAPARRRGRTCEAYACSTPPPEENRRSR